MNFIMSILKLYFRILKHIITAKDTYLRDGHARVRDDVILVFDNCPDISADRIGRGLPLGRYEKRPEAVQRKNDPLSGSPFRLSSAVC
jgi:hypothetical protein